MTVIWILCQINDITVSLESISGDLSCSLEHLCLILHFPCLSMSVSVHDKKQASLPIFMGWPCIRKDSYHTSSPEILGASTNSFPSRGEARICGFVHLPCAEPGVGSLLHLSAQITVSTLPQVVRLHQTHQSSMPGKTDSSSLVSSREVGALDTWINSFAPRGVSERC